MVAFQTLNIGCGEDFWGDVRLDIRKTNATTVLSDAQNLPFRDKTFDVAKLWHVLEHLENPEKALKECIRVTRYKVIIAFPTESDLYPDIISYLASLPFSIRAVFEWCRWRKERIHKWIIKPMAIKRFLQKYSWKCKIIKEKARVQLLTLFRSKRAPKRLRKLAKFVPYIAHQYVIIAEKGGYYGY